MTSHGRKIVQCVQEKYLDQITEFQPRAASESSDHDCGIESHTAVTEAALGPPGSAAERETVIGFSEAATS